MRGDLLSSTLHCTSNAGNRGFTSEFARQRLQLSAHIVYPINSGNTCIHFVFI